VRSACTRARSTPRMFTWDPTRAWTGTAIAPPSSCPSARPASPCSAARTPPATRTRFWRRSAGASPGAAPAARRSPDRPPPRLATPSVAPRTSRFDELDGQLWMEDVLVPWERIFLTDLSPDPIAIWCFWHQLYCWLAKAQFTLGLALACAHAMGLKEHEPTAEYLMDLVIDVQTVRSCQTAAELEPDLTTDGLCVPGRVQVAAGSIAMQKSRQRMAEILRILPGSSLVVAPSDKDLAS